MKKENIIWPISIIIVALILGLSYYFTQEVKQSNIINNQKILNQNSSSTIITAEDNFSKKIACEKYKDQIIKSIREYNSQQKPEVRDSNNNGTDDHIYNLYIENNELKEIFYSPKLNSCLYLESDKTLVKLGANADPNSGNWATSYETYYLIDALTNKKIDFNKGLNFLQIIHRGEMFTSEKDAENIINEYK